MSIALQVALFLASISIVALVVCVVPIAFQVGRSLRHLALTTEHLEATAQTLLLDSRELVRNVSDLSDRASVHMQEVEKVARIVQVWTARADKFSTEVGSILEPSILSLVRSSNLLRVGAAAFLRTFFHTSRQEQAKY